MADAVVDKFRSHEQDALGGRQDTREAEQSALGGQQDALGGQQDARKAEQEALHLSSAFLHAFDYVWDLVTVVAMNSGVLRRMYSSPSHSLVLGRDPLSCNGDVATVQLHTPEFITDKLPLLTSAFKQGQLNGCTGELWLLHADGHRMPFEWRVSVDQASSGCAIIICRDIADRCERVKVQAAKLAEKERILEENCAILSANECVLAEKEQIHFELQQLVETANAPIFQTDAEGRLVRCNPKAVSMLGYEGTDGELLGQRLTELVPAESRPAVEAVLRKALVGEETESYKREVLYPGN